MFEQPPHPRTSSSLPTRVPVARRFRALMAIGATAALLSGVAATPALADPPPSPTAQPQVVPYEGQSTELPELRNWTWMVADADSGNVLAGRDWHWPLPPASTLKTLTALTMVNRLELDSQYRVQQSETNAEGSKVGVKAGSQYTVRDLFNGMLMPSGNDAAMALANAYGGMDRATAAMTEEAQRIGAKDTVVKNTSGLDEPGQVSTAYDLALIMRESLKNPTLADIYKQHDVQFPCEQPKDPSAERCSYTIWTENRLVLNYYPGALGGKTGFTSQAGRTYVGAAEKDGHRLIVVIMRSAESTEHAVERILDWGFANIDKVQPVDHLVDPTSDPQVTAQQAVSYDEGGTSNLEQVRTDSTEQGGGVNPMLMIALLAGVAALVIIVRRRQSPTTSRRADQSIDLRERDRTPTP